MTTFSDDTIPYFAWDRNITTGQIRTGLQNSSEEKTRSLAAWIMREAAFADVWQFISPQSVADMLPYLKNQLGRRQGFWTHIIRTWHDLGKI